MKLLPALGGVKREAVHCFSSGGRVVNIVLFVDKDSGSKER